jgi:preprotein translocase subunit YajC
MIDVVTNAYAMGGAPNGQAGGNPIIGLLPLIVMFVIFYFLIIMPQQKKAKKHKQMIESLKKGDKVLTAGGIYGTVTGVAEKAVTIDIGNDVKIKVNKNYITAVMSQEFDADF